MEKGKLVVGIIPDGNRTWCEHRKVKNLAVGYRRNARQCVRIIQNAPRLGIGRLVFYVLSHYDIKNRPAGWLESWESGVEEFSRLLLQLYLPKLRVNVHGSYQTTAIQEVQKLYGQNRRADLVVDLLFGYSPEWDFQTRPIRTAEIPEIDFVVRTAGGNRLSGFLPLQTNYAELYFYHGLWPSFGYQALRFALVEYRTHKIEMKRRGGRGA